MFSNRTIPLSASFGCVRRYDVHTGIDIYGPYDASGHMAVTAIEDGCVVRTGQFTGSDVGSEWWLDTWYVAIMGKSGCAVYGELGPDLPLVGTFIKKGFTVGFTTPVLRKDKGVSPREMLHLELYQEVIDEPVEWLIGEDRPENLLNPTSFAVKGMYEYDAISRFYEGRFSARSAQPYMKHIDQGLEIMNRRNARQVAMLAYCLHPILQADEDFVEANSVIDMNKVNPEALMLAVEYRSVANEYLSRRRIGSIKEIRLSPSHDVNEMLVADKVQNYTDFLKHHQSTHPRSAELRQYFKAWLKRLGVDRHEFKKLLV